MFNLTIPLSALLLLLAAAASATEQLNDPLRPPGKQQSSKGSGAIRSVASYHVSSILITGGERRAIINGHMVTEGETLNGARVRAISANQVILERGGKRLTLDFLPYSIKKPSEANGQ